MNPLYLTRKHSALTALAAVACFSTICHACPADEKADAGTQQKSPRTVIEENVPPVAPYRAPVRLATGAAARGWLGHMPPRRQAPQPKSVLPPPAPPMEPVDADSFPAPAPPAAIRRTLGTPPPLSLRRGTTFPSLSNSGTTSTESASTVNQSLNARPISQSETSPPETPSVAAPKEASPAVSDIDLLLYGRPLKSVSLSSAIQPQTLTGEALKTPDDHAGQILVGFGVYEELPAVRYGRSCQNGPYPMFFNPLYFEDPNLERCGQGHGCFTELVSAIRFFGRVPVVPYMLGANPPLSCVPSLGDCPTCHAFGCDAYLPPLDKDAAALQTACTVGLIFLLP